MISEFLARSLGIQAVSRFHRIEKAGISLRIGISLE